MLEGININLRVMEEEDIILFHEWNNRIDFGVYTKVRQNSKEELEKRLKEISDDMKFFIIEKKDGTKIGFINYFVNKLYNFIEIGFLLIPFERKKGYCTEAVKILVDFLFLSKDIVRIQAGTDKKNLASQRVLENAGFTKEGIMRKMIFIRGNWTDSVIYSILRDEWQEPKILKV